MIKLAGVSIRPQAEGNLCGHAFVAQGIEQRFPVPRVGGSNPLGCIISSRLIKGKIKWDIF